MGTCTCCRCGQKRKKKEKELIRIKNNKKSLVSRTNAAEKPGRTGVEPTRGLWVAGRTSSVSWRGHQTAAGGDVEKEKETHSYLSKEEIKEKVHKYNLAVTDKLKMTLNSNGIYTGFIKVQMELCKPSQSSPNPGKLAPSSNGYMNTLHISSTNTVGEVIEALLKKFLVTESPTKFALYKRCHREDQVYACKLSDREHPLYLRLVAGPRTDTLSFVLREHEIGEWEAFSLPELQNFLRILDKEEDEQLQNLKERYAAYRHKLEEALGEAWKPG
uniref:Ras association domain-containing protein 3 n=1 Tax=Sus scrofa TaxID=9823 RepID=A0A8D0SX91_PIG